MRGVGKGVVEEVTPDSAEPAHCWIVRPLHARIVVDAVAADLNGRPGEGFDVAAVDAHGLAAGGKYLRVADGDAITRQQHAIVAGVGGRAPRHRHIRDASQRDGRLARIDECEVDKVDKGEGRRRRGVERRGRRAVQHDVARARPWHARSRGNGVVGD